MSNAVKTVPVYDLEGNEVGKIKLPRVFSYEIREDVIRRAYLAAFTARVQPQGRDPMAGKRTTAESWGVGYGIARVPRVKGERHPRAASAAFVTMAVGGRRAHAPTVRKVVHEKINKKERRLAIMSAIAATANRDLVLKRGHIVPQGLSLPIVVKQDIENLEATKHAREVLMKLGLWDDVMRVHDRVKVRAGKGKVRGRRYKEGKSLLVVLSGKCKALKAFRNLPGVTVVYVDNLSVLHLAPGGIPGRLTLWSEGAIKRLVDMEV
ncbi:MAG: 50S ribosomal protein L4 [Candidatus Nezhaarchaeota archaeon]|nr:50S ribosomal protein L4 [Candidatus Nezhaarchaeota archaeon]MCX8141894.1 50S ribosomal protein L4 [Candidatus Nezhaarchaeota archaeon]MDW8050325.1 50S ribosomal protein L4 [Nitrososphaerota archaeon]